MPAAAWRYDLGEVIRYPKRTSDTNWRICVEFR